MQIHPSITVSVRPAPLPERAERPAANAGEPHVAGDRRPGRIVSHREPPLGQSVRMAVEEFLAARVAAGETHREAPEPARSFDLRGHLAELDRDVSRRLEHFGRQHGLDGDAVRDIARSFHQRLRAIYDKANGTDAGPQRVNRAVRRAFQAVRADLRALVREQVDPTAAGGVTSSAGGAATSTSSEVQGAADTASGGSGSGTTTTTSVVPGVTVSVGSAPPPPPIPVPEPAAEERDPLAVLADALTQFVNRFDSMMDLFEALLANELGGGSSSGGSGSGSLAETLSELLAGYESGAAVDQNG